VGLDGFLGGGGGGGGGGYPLVGLSGLGPLSGFLGRGSFLIISFFSLPIFLSFYKFKVTKLDNKIEPIVKHAIENMLRQ